MRTLIVKFFPQLEAKVERVNDEKIHCVKDNIVMELRQQDLRQHCFDDLFNLLTVYVIAFRNPECPNRYTTCFATLLDDFGAELARNSMVAEPTSQCCDKKAAERISVSRPVIFISKRIYCLSGYIRNVAYSTYDWKFE